MKLVRVLALLVGLSACAGTTTSPSTKVQTPGPSQSTKATYDVDALGVPQFVNVIYIDLTQRTANGEPLVNQISTFRSMQGHDYSDSYESCRSMKHYLSFPDETTSIYSPVSGTVAYYDVGPGTANTDVFNITADAQPAFTFTVFHAVLTRKFSAGEHVTEGQLLGHHVGSFTSSDIAVLVDDGKNTPKTSGYGPNGRLVSYFLTLTDAAFAPFRVRGISSPSDLVISKTARDATPLRCVGESFDPSWTDPLINLLHF